MLYERYDSSLDKLIVPRDAFHPFPDSLDRTAWENLDIGLKRALLDAGEKALVTPWPELPATLYLDFSRTGTRRLFEASYFSRRKLLASLVLAECVEGKGRFLDSAVNAIWSICEESSWCLPAHIGAQKSGSTLPDTIEPIVDLFAAETGNQIAWADYLLTDRLNEIAKTIRPRLQHEVQQRILSPCLDRNDFGWMGFRSARVNNWNPWINSNWLACVMLMENDESRRLKAVSKMLSSVDKFIDGYGDDGGCDEGPVYWTRAGASLFDCLELLYRASGGNINVFNDSKIANIGRYIYRAHIAGQWFVNFADASARVKPPASLLYHFGRRINDELLMELGAFFNKTDGTVASQATDNGLRTLQRIFGCADLETIKPREPLPRSVWLGDIQVMVARCAEGSPTGLTVAAKGGHNNESHNHNDVGQFIVYANGDPVLIDIGVEIYTRKTFSAERYDIWTMRSLYHNLPSVNGCEQLAGRQFAARVVSHHADETMARLRMDIAPAYDPKAGITQWIRQIELDRAASTLSVTDEWQLSSDAKDITWRFITPCEVTFGAGQISLASRPLPNGQSGAGIIKYDATALMASVEELPVTDGNLISVWGDKLYRILLNARQPARIGHTTVIVSDGQQVAGK